MSNSIGDTVWKDVNKDGVIDGDEPRLPNVTIALLNDADDNIASTITDVNGMYSFTGLPDGDYTVVVTDTNNVLGDLIQTYDADDGATLAPTTPRTSFVDDIGVGVPTAAVNPLQDFGFAEPNTAGNVGEIGDTIFFDENEDDSPDRSEGIEGVTVNLFDPGPDGDIDTPADNVLIATTTTNRIGVYGFSDLSVADTGVEPGTTYQVVVDTTTLPNGSSEWINSVDPDTPNPGDSVSQVTLMDVDGERINLEQDFGYTSNQKNSVEGDVWPDSNGDGMQDESGVFGDVTVEIRDGGGKVFKSSRTNSAGRFSFRNLPDGMFMVEVTDEDNLLNGFTHTDTPNGPTDTSDETSKDDTGYEVDLDSEGVIPTPVIDTTADFGYKQAITNPISLGSFRSTLSSGSGATVIEWQTQTEVANIGFIVYGRVEQEWQALQSNLVLSQGDSVQVQRYRIELTTDATVFAIADVDLRGKETLHGPFKRGEAYGNVGERKLIDWKREKQQRETKQNARKAKREAHQQQRTLQRLQEKAKRGVLEPVSTTAD